MKKIDPKKLTLPEIWRLYRILEKSLGKEIQEDFYDNLSPVVQDSSISEMSEILRILYDDIDFSEKTICLYEYQIRHA